jgi:hypothetical protein
MMKGFPVISEEDEESRRFSSHSVGTRSRG